VKLVLKIAAGVILAVVVMTAGCAALIGGAAHSASKEMNKKEAWSVDVVADGCWSGSIGSSSYDGCGSRRITFKDSVITAATVQKQDEGSWRLGLKLVKDGEVLDSSSTSAQYGVVSVDGSDFDF
jgi:hypothetical protein